jgi:hypothetical protein
MVLLELQAMDVPAQEGVKFQSCSSVVEVTGCVSVFSVFC